MEAAGTSSPTHEDASPTAPPSPTTEKRLIQERIEAARRELEESRALQEQSRRNSARLRMMRASSDGPGVEEGSPAPPGRAPPSAAADSDPDTSTDDEGADRFVGDEGASASGSRAPLPSVKLTRVCARARLSMFASLALVDRAERLCGGRSLLRSLFVVSFAPSRPF